MSLRLLEDAHDDSTKALLHTFGVRRFPPSKGIAESWCKRRDEKVKNWPDNVPPKPDWENLQDGYTRVVQDDMPTAPTAEDVAFDVEFEGLELSQHQKVMLLPVDLRIHDLVYPSAVQARVAQLRSGRRTNKWSANLKGHFIGKMQAKWRAAVQKLGVCKAREALEQQMGPVVVIKTHAKHRAKAKRERTSTKNPRGTSKREDCHPIHYICFGGLLMHAPSMLQVM